MKSIVPAHLTRAISSICLVFVGFLPITTSAAFISVDFSASINESYDQNFDDITGTYSDIQGVFIIDTDAPVLGGAGNFPGAVFGMYITRDGAPLLSQDDFSCAASCANDVFVSSSAEANVYVQDFFVGNLNLNLAPASGVIFDNDINVFLLAAQGNVTDYFDIFASYGSVQVDGEDYFDLYELNMEVIPQVPVPGAVWLFGSALAGLGWLRRKQTA